MATTVLNTPEQIESFRLATLKQAIKLESLGMKRAGRPASMVAKELLGLPKGASRETVIREIDRLLGK